MSPLDRATYGPPHHAEPRQRSDAAPLPRRPRGAALAVPDARPSAGSELLRRVLDGLKRL
jgi:hypothetical protein